MFRKLGFQVSRADVEGIIANSPGAIERVLHYVYSRLLSSQQVPSSQAQLSNKISEMSIMKKN